MALTAPRNTIQMGDQPIARRVHLPVAAAVRIFAGALVCSDANGYATPGAAATTLRGVGRARSTVDNSTGLAGALSVEVEQGIFKFANSADADEVTIAQRGAVCFIVDDATVAKTDGSSTRSPAGLVVDVETDGVWVEMRSTHQIPDSPAALEADLAATTNGDGASKIGVEDAAAHFTGANVEAVLQELGDAMVKVVADPGTGVALPVTDSASIAIETAAAETNTLADPTFQGQTLTLFADTYAVGDRVVTAASRVNQAGNTVMTFGAAGDFIKLEAITIGGALKWQVVSNDGVALS